MANDKPCKEQRLSKKMVLTKDTKVGTKVFKLSFVTFVIFLCELRVEKIELMLLFNDFLLPVALVAGSLEEIETSI